MRPAISDGDSIFVSTGISEIERGDIIYFRYPRDPEEFYMKRVIGLPGETIEIVDGITMINGVKLQESYVDSKFNQTGSSHPRTAILPDQYFVMGDNRDNSSDSRYWGAVERELIVGKYIWKYASADPN